VVAETGEVQLGAADLQLYGGVGVGDGVGPVDAGEGELIGAGNVGIAVVPSRGTLWEAIANEMSAFIP
jgi:hypothetical protein